MTWAEYLDLAGEVLGIELWRIPLVVVSAVGIYFAFLLLVRLFGSRILTGLAGFDIVMVIMFGAVAGRVVIGHPPSLAAGVIGLATLMATAALFALLRRNVDTVRIIDSPPTVVLAHGEILEEYVWPTHVTREDIVVALRSAGCASFDQAQCVVLESNGTLSVIRAGTRIEPALLWDVRGAEEVLESGPEAADRDGSAEDRSRED
ncbi:DUF421 domain-containing protein [Brevibacterium litoralis]|uniref:DUF421 domain-containing protein n=1 Tax=Brevibacterium litoralis TaxID=3138935 RepID=UPI0032EDFA73